MNWAWLLLVPAMWDEPVVSAEVAFNRIEWRSVEVAIQNEAGQPIVGAELRVESLGGDNWRATDWPIGYGAPPTGVSDAAGRVMLRCPSGQPEQLGGFPFQIQKLFVVVQHAVHVGRRTTISLDGDAPKKVVLQTGVELRFTGVRSGSMTPLEHCYLLAEAGSEEVVGWSHCNTGAHDVRLRVGVGEHRMRMVQLAPGKMPLFSKVTIVDTHVPETLHGTLTLVPGVRMEGRLSEDVPRPVKAGRVVVCCAVRRAADQFKAGGAPMTWYEAADVAPDGTFVLPALPPGTLAQVFVNADDWTSQLPDAAAKAMACDWLGMTPQDLENRFPLPRQGQIVRLTNGTQRLEVAMEKCGTLEAVCEDAEGRALSGLDVAYLFQYESLGAEVRQALDFTPTRAALEQQIDGHQPGEQSMQDFGVRSDATGRARLTLLPPGAWMIHATRGQQIHCFMPVTVVGGQSTTVTLRPMAPQLPGFEPPADWPAEDDAPVFRRAE